jgi:uroporphyrinogen-III synthase
VAAIGEVTAAALAEAGLPADVVAAEPGARALVAALAAHVAGAEEAR